LILDSIHRLLFSFLSFLFIMSSRPSKPSKPSKRKAVDICSSQTSTCANASNSSDSEVEEIEEVEEVEEEELVLPEYVTNAHATPKDTIKLAKERLDEMTKDCFLAMAEGVKSRYAKPGQVMQITLCLSPTPQREAATEKAILYMNRLGWDVQWGHHYGTNCPAYVNIKDFSNV
jgi:hypothetical protein